MITLSTVKKLAASGAILAGLGFAAVGNEAAHVRSVLEHIVNALRGHPVAEFIDHELEV